MSGSSRQLQATSPGELLPRCFEGKLCRGSVLGQEAGLLMPSPRRARSCPPSPRRFSPSPSLLIWPHQDFMVKSSPSSLSKGHHNYNHGCNHVQLLSPPLRSKRALPLAYKAQCSEACLSHLSALGTARPLPQGWWWALALPSQRYLLCSDHFCGLRPGM